MGLNICIMQGSAVTQEGIKIVEPLTEETVEKLLDQGPVINGNRIYVRYTHPTLYLMTMLSGSLEVLLALNFLFLNPTFLIYGQPNYLWGSIFLLLGFGKIFFLNFFRSLRIVRFSMAASFSYIMLIAYGTCQPFAEGEGSLQLPLLYMGWAVLYVALLLEPFINPWTARQGR